MCRLPLRVELEAEILALATLLVLVTGIVHDVPCVRQVARTRLALEDVEQPIEIPDHVAGVAVEAAMLRDRVLADDLAEISTAKP
jgi:hypothetical protein